MKFGGFWLPALVVLLATALPTVLGCHGAFEINGVLTSVSTSTASASLSSSCYRGVVNASACESLVNECVKIQQASSGILLTKNRCQVTQYGVDNFNTTLNLFDHKFVLRQLGTRVECTLARTPGTYLWGYTLDIKGHCQLEGSAPAGEQPFPHRGFVLTSCSAKAIEKTTAPLIRDDFNIEISTSAAAQLALPTLALAALGVACATLLALV